MDAGRIPEAEEVFRYVLHQSPSDPDAICGLAGTALARRAPQEAFDLLAKARPIHPQHAGLLALLSSAHSALGRFQEALVCIDAAIRIAPDDPGHRSTYVQLLLALNRPDDALAAIIAAEESLGERGRTPDLMNVKGMLLMQRGESRAGIEAFRAAFEVDPDRVEFAHNLAVALHGLGYAEEALRFAERAYLNDPGDVGYRLGFARCLISLGRLQEAKEMLQRAQALAPQDVAAIGLLAGLLISSGDPDTALAMCANLVRQKNQSPDACLMLAQNLRLAGRFEQALAVLPHARGASETKDVAEALENEIHLCLGRTISTESIGDVLPINTFTIGRTGLAEAILCSRWLTTDMTLHAPGELTRLFEACGQASVTPNTPEEAAPIVALLSMDRRTPPAPDAFFPYLRLPDDVVKPWRDALAKLPGPRIGLMWDHAAPGVSLGSLWPALEGVGTVISLASDPLRHDLQDFP
ncbi:MAG TPA: tetratricopeptide repeat protein, partial [Methylovirgula sp.]|nr:tetratricopeptide repeat protein [Methylovirgula sp.]